LGAILTPLIVTPIALWWGWRAAFWFTGLTGLAWTALWLGVSRRKELRTPGSTTGPAQSALSFADPRLWSFMLAYAMGALPIGFVIYAAPIYLSQSWHFSQASLGKVLWIPPLGWELGYFFWGWLSDRKLRLSHAPMRAFQTLFTLAVLLSIPLVLTTRLPRQEFVMAELFLAMFAASGFLILPIAYATHVFSSAHSGLIAGLGAGAWSAAVAAVMPVFGRLLDHQQTGAAFAVATAAPLAGYLVWMFVNARIAPFYSTS